MSYYAGLDASKNMTSVCIIDLSGAIIAEETIETTPQSIISFFGESSLKCRRIGVESMSITPWLYEPMVRAGLPVICIESKHARSILKARLNKTDRNDARGIADMMRVSLYKAVHIKTAASRQGRLLLSMRRLLVIKQRDIDNFIRSVLLQEGYKLTPRQQYSFETRAAASVEADSVLKEIIGNLLDLRRAIVLQLTEVNSRIASLVEQDNVCKRLMTAPGVGPITALSYRVAIDVPSRFSRSRDVGAHLGLTPAAFRSGTIDRRGRISKCGDQTARSALFLAARSVLRKNTKNNALKAWGTQIAGRRGHTKATVAVARRLAVILHRMWVTASSFEEVSGPPPLS